jgi:hypothetical protein
MGCRLWRVQLLNYVLVSSQRRVQSKGLPAGKQSLELYISLAADRPDSQAVGRVITYKDRAVDDQGHSLAKRYLKLGIDTCQTWREYLDDCYWHVLTFDLV